MLRRFEERVSINDEGLLWQPARSERDNQSRSLRRAQLDLLYGRVSLQGDQIGEVLLPPELVNSQRTLIHSHYWSSFTLMGSPW